MLTFFISGVLSVELNVVFCKYLEVRVNLRLLLLYELHCYLGYILNYVYHYYGVILKAARSRQLLSGWGVCKLRKCENARW